MAHKNIWKDQTLYRVFTDKVSGEEILNSNLKLQGDARFDDIKCIINDFSNITAFEINEDDIEYFVAMDNASALSKSRLKIAIVATDKDLLSFVYLYCAKMEDSPYECRLFDDINSVQEWAS